MAFLPTEPASISSPCRLIRVVRCSSIARLAGHRSMMSAAWTVGCGTTPTRWAFTWSCNVRGSWSSFLWQNGGVVDTISFPLSLFILPASIHISTSRWSEFSIITNIMTYWCCQKFSRKVSNCSWVWTLARYGRRAAWASRYTWRHPIVWVLGGGVISPRCFDA